MNKERVNDDLKQVIAELVAEMKHTEQAFAAREQELKEMCRSMVSSLKIKNQALQLRNKGKERELLSTGRPMHDRSVSEEKFSGWLAKISRFHSETCVCIVTFTAEIMRARTVVYNLYCSLK